MAQTSARQKRSREAKRALHIATYSLGHLIETLVMDDVARGPLRVAYASMLLAGNQIEICGQLQNNIPAYRDVLPQIIDILERQLADDPNHFMRPVIYPGS